MVKEQHTRMAKNSKVTNQPKQNQSETSQNATGAPLPPPPPPQHGQRRRSLSHLLLQPISEPKISLSSKHEKSTSKGRARGGEKKARDAGALARSFLLPPVRLSPTPLTGALPPRQQPGRPPASPSLASRPPLDEDALTAPPPPFFPTEASSSSYSYYWARGLVVPPPPTTASLPGDDHPWSSTALSPPPPPAAVVKLLNSEDF